MKITPAETKIMDLLWEREPRGSEEMVQDLMRSEGWRTGTIRTLLARLVKKGAVGVEAEGRRYSYRPLIARADYAKSESESLIDRLFAGELTPMVAQFTRSRPLSPKDLEALKALIAEIEDDIDDNR